MLKQSVTCQVRVIGKTPPPLTLRADSYAPPSIGNQTTHNRPPRYSDGEDQPRFMAALPSKSYPRAIGQTPHLPVTYRVRAIGKMAMLSVGYRQ